ncbi:MAG: hypothetical protein HQM08_07265 [Candidatus Riflebacteria bacterium]|nr:hypothetical protein [Candidatus Riflebacteria bacterium]
MIYETALKRLIASDQQKVSVCRDESAQGRCEKLQKIGKITKCEISQTIVDERLWRCIFMINPDFSQFLWPFRLTSEIEFVILETEIVWIPENSWGNPLLPKSNLYY